MYYWVSIEPPGWLRADGITEHRDELGRLPYGAHHLAHYRTGEPFLVRDVKVESTPCRTANQTECEQNGPFALDKQLRTREFSR